MEEFTINHLKQQVNIGEAYKLVNKYINVLKTDNGCMDKINKLFTTIDDKNLFDLSVKLCIIDGLKLTDELMKCLLCQDPYQVKRLVKCKWFFEASLDPNYYIKNVFPVVSISTRCKLATALSKNIQQEHQAETFYQFFSQNYNRGLADIFLPKCSREFILSAIKKYPLHYSVNRNCRIVKSIYNKYPDVGIQIIDSMFFEARQYQKVDVNNTLQIGDNIHQRTVLLKFMNYLSDVNFDKYFNYYQNYNILFQNHFKLGRMRTRKLVLQYSREISEKPELYIKVLRKDRLMKRLSLDGKVTFFGNYVKLLPVTNYIETSSWATFEEKLESWKIMSFIRPVERLDFYLRTFQQSYNRDLMECPRIWSKKFLELLPSSKREECIKKLLDLKIIKENELENYFYLYEPHKLVSNMKQKLRKEPDAQKRELYLFSMVESCALEQNINLLEDVCQYIMEHHKNENERIASKLIKTLIEKFKHKNFTIRMWEIYKSLAKLAFVQEGCTWYTFQELYPILLKYNFKNNVSYSEELKIMVQYYVENTYTKIPKKLEEVLILNRKIFDEFVDEAFKLVSKTPDKQPVVIMNFFNCWNRFNRKNRLNIMDSYPWLITLIETFAENSTDRYNVAWEFIVYPFILTSEQINSITKIMIGEENYVVLFLNRMMRMEPRYIQQHIKGIIEGLLDIHRPNEFYSKNLKIFQFLNMRDEMSKLICEQFENQDLINNKLILLHYGCYFCDAETYKSLYSKYIPQGENVDFTNDSDLLQISTKLVKFVKFLRPITQTTLQLLQSFLYKDFLRYGHNSLNHIVHHSQVEFIKPFLFNNLDKPVSVKKRIIKLIGEVLTTEENLKYFSNLWDKEKHYSAQNEIFKIITRCFLSQKSDTVWVLVKKCITQCDPLNLTSIPSIFEIPDCYLEDYVELVWKRYEQLDDFKYTKQKENFLACFTDKIFLTIDKEVPRSILQNYLFIEEEICKCNVQVFAFNYLRFLSRQNDFDFSFLDEIVQNKVNNVKEIHKFFHYLSDNAVFHTFRNDTQYMNKLLEMWSKNFSNLNFPKLYFHLYLSNLYISSRNVYGKNKQKLSVEFGVKLRKFYLELEYNKELLPILFDCTTNVLNWEKKGLKLISLTDVLNGILRDNSNRDSNILAVLLFKIVQIDDKNQNEFASLIDIFKSLNDTIINSYISQYLNDHCENYTPPIVFDFVDYEESDDECE